MFRPRKILRYSVQCMEGADSLSLNNPEVNHRPMSPSCPPLTGTRVVELAGLAPGKPCLVTCALDWLVMSCSLQSRSPIRIPHPGGLRRFGLAH